MSSTTVYLQELPYHPDSHRLFQRVRDLPSALLFDSGYPYSRRGRFDIMAADPLEKFILYSKESDTYDSYIKYFTEIAAAHESLFSDISSPAEDLPFCGGMAGYLGYGLGKPLQYIAAEASARGQLSLYGWAVIQDHLLQRCTFAALPLLDRAGRGRILDRLRGPAATDRADFQLCGEFTSNLNPGQYESAFRSIQKYILAGDCYQVNLAQRFSAGYRGDPWRAYQLLRPLAGAPYAGYMACDDGSQLLCLSPERFLSLHGRCVETRPIKGTRPRHRDPETDALLARELQISPKDRAENLMIVDLLRNDMGKNCVAGSIHVDRLFELEAYPGVYHLVSTISGELKEGRSAYDLLRDSFPGGSVTGAPKRRAMEIIDELEPHPRQAYCGSMLYVSPDGRLDSNITIRSLVCRDGAIHCWGGGGIVADSNWEKEYQETFDKVGQFLGALESTRRVKD